MENARLKIHKEVVEAKSRTLTVSWSFEINKEVEVFRGLNPLDVAYHVPYKSKRISAWDFFIWAHTQRTRYEIKKDIDNMLLFELKNLT